MNNYPSIEDYEKLYARFQERDPRGLFNEVNVKNKSVIDLCCGGGRATLAALKLGASHVTMVDECPNMMNKDIPKKNPLKVCMRNQKVYNALSDIKHTWYDIAVCQQAINYWFVDYSIELLLGRLKKGGYFIFNTFNQKPLKEPVTRTYLLNNLKYTEVNQLVDDVVYHSQYCEGLPPHHTSFRWIDRKEFGLTLRKYFSKVREIKDGPTSIWVSQK